MMRRSWIGRGVRGLAVAVLAIVVFGYGVMLLWNWLMPSLAGLHRIAFAQALGLLVLCRILFGGIRGRGGWGWRHRMQERFAQLSPEERARFRERMHRCGAPPADSPPSAGTT